MAGRSLRREIKLCGRRRGGVAPLLGNVVFADAPDPLDIVGVVGEVRPQGRADSERVFPDLVAGNLVPRRFISEFYRRN